MTHNLNLDQLRWVDMLVCSLINSKKAYLSHRHKGAFLKPISAFFCISVFIHLLSVPLHPAFHAAENRKRDLSSVSEEGSNEEEEHQQFVRPKHNSLDDLGQCSLHERANVLPLEIPYSILRATIARVFYCYEKREDAI